MDYTELTEYLIRLRFALTTMSIYSEDIKIIEEEIERVERVLPTFINKDIYCLVINETKLRSE